MDKGNLSIISGEKSFLNVPSENQYEYPDQKISVTSHKKARNYFKTQRQTSLADSKRNGGKMPTAPLNDVYSQYSNTSSRR